jgi:Protein of unknown function (DUF3224)
MNTPHLLTRRTVAMAAVIGYAELSMTTPSSAQPTSEARVRTSHLAKGTFTVQMKPLSESGFDGGNANLGRMSLDKIFEGDLMGVGKGEMLTAMTQTKGSAGYVAIERVTGTLHGHKGSFVFQHMGSMNKGAQSLSITVVPDSGSGDLIGLEGIFKIRIESSKHFYELEYSLPQLMK